MSAHDDYLDPDLAGLNDEIADNEHVKDAFSDYQGPGPLYRALYKYTACGPSLGITISFYEQGCERETSKTLYCDSLYDLGTWQDMDKKGQLIVAFHVSSIVEGVDYGTETHTVSALIDDLITAEQEEDNGSPANTLHRCLFIAVSEVNSEASSIWNSTHGCEGCAKHWHSEGITEGEWGPMEGCDGATQIWKDCPDCGGNGTIV